MLTMGSADGLVITLRRRAGRRRQWAKTRSFSRAFGSAEIVALCFCEFWLCVFLSSSLTVTL